MRTGEVVGDRFVVERLIGSGGMGSVFLAHDRFVGGPVAIKALDLSSEGGIERFRREARVLADLSHPSIVRYVAHGESDSRQPYLVMELLDGEDLSQRLTRSRLTPQESLSTILKAAEALAFAHARGIVHRDIKPSNLFLAERDLARLKILDFGIARERFESQGLTDSGTMLGTVGYMAPEQATGASTADARADVFALGCVLFECLTGEAVFSGRHAIAVLAKVMSEPAPRVSDIRPELGTAADDLLARMLAKSPDARPQDAREVVTALDELIVNFRPHPHAAPSSPPASVSHREQRIVSVLLAEGLPDGRQHPEVERIREVSKRTGAELSRLQGGGLLLVIAGRGSAHDQALEAAGTALSLLRLVPELRLALATGRVEDTRHHPVGAPIDRAAALLRARRSDVERRPYAGVLLDDVTASLLGARFEIDHADGHPILVCEHDDLEAPRLFLGKPTPTVGREKELALCEGTLRECVEESVSRALIVTAPPGIGKSRLVSEFTAAVRASGRARVLMARTSPIGAGASLALVHLLVRRAVGLTPEQDAREQEAALRAYLTGHAVSAADGPIADFLAEIAGIPVDAPGKPLLCAARNDPAIMQEQKRRAFQVWIDAETARGPLLLLLEDLHWGDAPTITYLDDALRRLSNRPLMLLATARPEIHERFPKLWQKADVQEIRLGGLTRRPAERLVRTVLGDAAGPDVVTRIIDRAEGNVFYLEELVRRVAEGSATLPETVLAMAQSRLERLEPEARRVLRAASVYGEACSVGSVAALLDPAFDAAGWLEALVGRELLSHSSEVRHAGEREFCFRHALLRDAAYAMLTEEDRRNAHRLAGAWLEAHGEREPRVIADHFDAGGDGERALPWLCLAARAAVDSGDMSQAAEIAQRGRRLGATGEELGLLSALEGLAVTWSNQPSITQLREAIELLPSGVPLWWSAVGAAIYKIATSDDPGAAPEFVQHVFGPLPTDLTGPYGMAVSGVSGGLLALGQTDSAHAFLDQFRSEPAEDARVDPLFSAWLDLARSWCDLMSVRDGSWWIERSLSSSRAVRQRMSVCGAMLGEATSLYYVACAAIWLGLYEEAEAACMSSLTLARRAGADLLRIYVRLARAVIQVRTGRPAEALSALAALEPTVDASQAQLRELILAEAHLRLRRFEQCRAHALAATDGPVVQTAHWASAVLAQAHAALGESEPALALTRKVPTSLPLFDADLLTTRAEVLLRLGREADARAAARDARARILTVARDVSDPEVRRAFLGSVLECQRSLGLARDLLGEEAVPPA